MRREAMVLLVVASLLFLATTGVQAKATQTPFTACEKLTLKTFEKHWVDDDGVEHYRNWAWNSTFTSTLGPGSDYGVLGWNVDLATGNGDLFGTFNWAFDDFAPGVTFSGHFNGTFTAGAIEDVWVGHGGGLTVFGHGVSGSAACGGNSLQNGVILNPHE